MAHPCHPSLTSSSPKMPGIWCITCGLYRSAIRAPSWRFGKAPKKAPRSCEPRKYAGPRRVLASINSQHWTRNLEEEKSNANAKRSYGRYGHLFCFVDDTCPAQRWDRQRQNHLRGHASQAEAHRHVQGAELRETVFDSSHDRNGGNRSEQCAGERRGLYFRRSTG